MGSPYSISSSINSVHVVRTFRGLNAALMRVTQFASNPTFQRHIVKLIVGTVEQQCSSAALREDSERLWEVVGDDVGDYPLTVIMIEVAVRFCQAWRLNMRTAICLEPRYDWRGSDKFTRVIILDLTLDKRTPPNTGSF